MATKAASKRLGKEAQLMEKDPPPYCFARPREDSVLEWHFVLRGPPDTPFVGGEYWGQLLFPSDYPFKPPGIKMSTPSGRFHTDSKICTSMSDFHPGSWNPAWSVANILVGLLSFMCSDEMTTGSFMATAEDRKTLAAQSHAFNIKQSKFKKLFPEYSQSAQRDLPNMGEKKNVASSSSTTGSAQVASTSVSKIDTPSNPLKLPENSAAITNKSPLSAPTSKAIPASLQSAIAPAAIAIQGQPPHQARSKAFFPIIMALLAYLFFSRLASTMNGVNTTTAG